MKKNNLEILDTIDLNLYKAIIVDIDDTLYDYKLHHDQTISYIFQNDSFLFSKIGIKSCDEFILKYNLSRSFVKEQHPNNSLTRSRYLAFLKLFESQNSEVFSYKLAYEFECKYWDYFLGNMNVIDDQWIAFFERCFLFNIPICAVSDMQTRFQIQKLKKLKADKYIKFLVTSEDANVEKPDPKIFKMATNILNEIPKNILMLGDDVEKDINGSKNLGFKSIRVGFNIY